MTLTIGDDARGLAAFGTSRLVVEDAVNTAVSVVVVRQAVETAPNVATLTTPERAADVAIFVGTVDAGKPIAARAYQTE